MSSLMTEIGQAIKNRKGVANGFASLDATGKVPSSQISEVLNLADGKDVTITSPIDGQALVYEASTQLWKNKSASDTKLSTDGKSIVKSSNNGTIKNQCTAWVNFDGTTTPPTIRDSYNVSSVVRTSTGAYDIYFTTPMDNVNYSVSGSCQYIASSGQPSISTYQTGKSLNKVNTQVAYGQNNYNSATVDISILGGKN